MRIDRSACKTSESGYLMWELVSAGGEAETAGNKRHEWIGELVDDKMEH